MSSQIALPMGSLFVRVKWIGGLAHELSNTNYHILPGEYTKIERGVGLLLSAIRFRQISCVQSANRNYLSYILY